jgi:hypothetical protein
MSIRPNHGASRSEGVEALHYAAGAAGTGKLFAALYVT